MFFLKNGRDRERDAFIIIMANADGVGSHPVQLYVDSWKISVPIVASYKNTCASHLSLV
jgi:hypothetical protein